MPKGLHIMPVLGADADQLSYFCRVFPRRVSADGDVSGIGLQYCREDADRGRLAGAVRSQKPEYFSFTDGKRNPSDRLVSIK